MTYCLGITTRSGLIMAADSRTHAGVDSVSTYRKLFNFSVPGERVVLLCNSGSLSLTQNVLALLRQDLSLENVLNLHSCLTLFEMAGYVGSKIRQVHAQDRSWLKQDGINFSCNFLLGGQVRGGTPELYLIYNQGNFIQAAPDTPFFQIGETKYGKPILDCVLNYEMPLTDAAKCALLSIGSTMRSNLSVGPPISLVMYEADTLTLCHQLQLQARDPYLAEVNQFWEKTLKQAAELMPEIRWQSDGQTAAPGA